MELRYIANAGFWLGFGESAVLADGLHRGNREGYPQVGEELWEKMKAELPTPELTVFTHCHPDHFSSKMLGQARLVWRDTRIAAPERLGGEQILMTGERGEIELRSGSLEYLRLRHEGEEYSGVPHYGLLLRGDGLRVFASGDCRVASQELADKPELRDVDAAILNFPWITLRAGRRCIDELLRPKKLFICHIPEPDKDTLRYREAAERAAEKYYPDADVRLLTEPLESVTI